MHQLVHDPITGRFLRRYSCSSCHMLRINGQPCHERGCPDAWMDTSRECPNCGVEFIPESRDQAYCDES